MKSKQDSIPSPHPRQMFLEWYHSTTPGRLLQKSEASYLLNSLQLTYKQKILQVGGMGSEYAYIREEFGDNFALISEGKELFLQPGRWVQARLDALPVACESVDVLILPHILEFESNPHPLLNEAERILKPEGQLYVLGFNPWSPLGVGGPFPRQTAFPRDKFIGCHRLMDWLALLKFDAEFSAGFGLASYSAILKPDTLFNKSMAHLAAAYALRAYKRTYTLIPIKPAWRTAPGLMTGQIVDTPLMRKN